MNVPVVGRRFTGEGMWEIDLKHLKLFILKYLIMQPCAFLISLFLLSLFFVHNCNSKIEC